MKYRITHHKDECKRTDHTYLYGDCSISLEPIEEKKCPIHDGTMLMVTRKPFETNTIVPDSFETITLNCTCKPQENTEQNWEKEFEDFWWKSPSEPTKSQEYEMVKSFIRTQIKKARQECFKEWQEAAFKGEAVARQVGYREGYEQGKKDKQKTPDCQRFWVKPEQPDLVWFKKCGRADTNHESYALERQYLIRVIKELGLI